MSADDIGECDLTNDHGEGVHAEDGTDEDGASVMLTMRVGRGFGQDALTLWLSPGTTRELHAWLGQWLEAKGPDHG